MTNDFTLLLAMGALGLLQLLSITCMVYTAITKNRQELRAMKKLRDGLDNLLAQNKDLGNRLTGLEQDMKLLQQSHFPYGQPPSRSPEPASPLQPPVLYAQEPDDNGIFRKTGKTPEANSFYKLIPTDGCNGAFEFFCANEKRAIANKSAVLDSACEQTGVSYTAKGIENVTPGIIAYNGDKWEIRKKCQIRFKE
jgi:hypothetical protein